MIIRYRSFASSHVESPLEKLSTSSEFLHIDDVFDRRTDYVLVASIERPEIFALSWLRVSRYTRRIRAADGTNRFQGTQSRSTGILLLLDIK